MVTKRLIITADDFGLTEGVNKAIIRAHREGVVTSASLMINGGAVDSAVAFARQNPSLDIGLHLNLTNEPFAFALRPGAGIEKKIRQQIEMALKTGLTISHVDGHKHVHVIPAVSKLLRQVSQEYGIHALRAMNTRTPRPTFLLRHNAASRSAVLKQYLFAEGARFVWRLSSQKAMAGPDRFYGIAETGFLDLPAFTNIIEDLAPGTHEVMCHPGYTDAELCRTPTRLLQQRERELEMLTSRNVRDLIQDAGIQLVSYKDLVETYENHRTDSVLHRCSAL
jgi:chitin disaccharide deacetylase